MDKKLPLHYERAFKEADIRGMNVTEVDDDLAYCVARALVDEFDYQEVVVGYDMRVSSPSLVEAFMRGVEDAGAQVVSIGLVSSPMLYFASGAYNVPGVMVTASHSGPEYNGLKLVAPGAIPLTNPTGLTAIKRRVKKGTFKEPLKRGRRRAKNINTAFQSFVLKGINKAPLKDIRIAADIGNGMASVMLPLLEQKLPITFTTLFADMDARFPNRGSDPTIVKHQRHLATTLQTGQYDFGIAFDGDADRIAFLDERGRYVNCAVIGAMIAEHILTREPGVGIVFTNLTSRIFAETIKAAGGKPIRAKVGHAFLKLAMRQTNAAFGAEHSGHFFWREFFFTDSTVLTLRAVLEIYTKGKRSGQKFSEIVAPYQKYVQLEDVVIPVQDRGATLVHVEAYIRQKYHTAKIKKFDGLFVSTPEVWGVVKASVTEHAIKILLEGRQKKPTEVMQRDLIAFVRSIAHE